MLKAAFLCHTIICMGLFFVLLAIVGWGIGDFLIQRSARKLGDWEALFFVTLFATIVLLPFVFGRFDGLTPGNLALLIGTSFVILVAALFDFDALRVGKISVIEPVYAMEVPITVALSTLIIGEYLTSAQLVLVLILLAGVFLVSNRHFSRIHMRTLERGVIAAIVATVGMGLSNFLYGVSSRALDPLMINWFASAFMAAATLCYLIYYGQLSLLWRSWSHNKKLIVQVGTADVVAWVAYSSATLYMPIGLATGLTESYVALAALLGLFINKEKLRWHQHAGLALAVCAAIGLAFISPS